MGSKGEERPLRVLVVEDEPLQGWLALRILEREGGMETALAADGREGLELAWSFRPHVILLDLVLPGMSGLELLRQYRGEGGKAGVLAVTGVRTEWSKRMSVAAGADFVLEKPICWEELPRTLRMLGGGLEAECLRLLKAMGAKGPGKGVRQAARCAALLGEGRCQLLKEAYIEVAARERSSPANVSKNIERMIEKLHAGGSPLYRRLLGRGPTDPEPTNREFLDILSQAARSPL